MKQRSPSLAILCVVTLLVAWSTHIFGQKKVAAQTETAWGLHTVTFDTVHGKVIVNVPDDTAAGDTISGTVIAEPSGKNEAERAKNQDELNGYVVEIEKQKTPVMEKVLKWAVPVGLAGGTASVILRDRQGNEVARTNVPVNPTAPSTPLNWSNPPACQTGRPVSIPGPNSVDVPTEVTIGGKSAEIAAQSPRAVYAWVPQDVSGKTAIEVRKGGETVHQGQIRAISIQLSATSTALKRGQQARLTVIVRGLENLAPDEKVPVQLTNKTPAVVRVEGGDVQNFTIARGDPHLDPRTGIWTNPLTLTGVRPGGFTILAQAVDRPMGPPGGPPKAPGLPEEPNRPKEEECVCKLADMKLEIGKATVSFGIIDIPISVKGKIITNKKSAWLTVEGTYRYELTGGSPSGKLVSFERVGKTEEMPIHLAESERCEKGEIPINWNHPGLSFFIDPTWNRLPEDGIYTLTFGVRGDVKGCNGWHFSSSKTFSMEVKGGNIRSYRIR